LTYDDMVEDPDRVSRILDVMSPLHPAERIENWRGLLIRRDWQTLSEGLLRAHYAPRYNSHRARHDDGRGTTVALQGLTDLDAAAGAVEDALVTMRRP
ncbi:MAG: tRNA 2-selenouridine(34) synthase MnmH, partial [Paracoccus sp. (in: a-proteobacteria)]|nr:tRNA 2-selenouridine(34) synthase MnmH [Paracoccus sp. (in: a-proteobacteria)]